MEQHEQELPPEEELVADESERQNSSFLGRTSMQLFKIFTYENKWATVQNGFTVALTTLLYAVSAGIIGFTIWLLSRIGL